MMMTPRLEARCRQEYSANTTVLAFPAVVTLALFFLEVN